MMHGQICQIKEMFLHVLTFLFYITYCVQRKRNITPDTLAAWRISKLYKFKLCDTELYVEINQDDQDEVTSTAVQYWRLKFFFFFFGITVTGGKSPPTEWWSTNESIQLFIQKRSKWEKNRWLVKRSPSTHNQKFKAERSVVCISNHVAWQIFGIIMSFISSKIFTLPLSWG